MRIISWNVNGFRARQGAIERLVKEYEPNLLCCQKIRVGGGFIFQVPGYFSWLGCTEPTLPGGVATFIKKPFIPTAEGVDLLMPQWLKDTGCLQMLPFEDVAFVNAYFPYANKYDQKWIDIRRQWDYEIHDYLVALSKRMPIVMCGDLNIVDKDIDAWNGVSVKKDGCFFDWIHRNFDSMRKAVGLVDSFRALHPDDKSFSYFHRNQPEYRLNNQGFRIDYFLASESLMPKVKRSEIIQDYIDTDSNPILLDIE